MRTREILRAAAVLATVASTTLGVDVEGVSADGPRPTTSKADSVPQASDLDMLNYSPIGVGYGGDGVCGRGEKVPADCGEGFQGDGTCTTIEMMRNDTPEDCDIR